jgi:hypothetical protein
MSKLKSYEIDAVTDKVMELLRKEWSKKQPNFAKENKERLALQVKIDKLETELQDLRDLSYKMNEDMQKKYKDIYIYFDGKEYHSQDNNWQVQSQVRQEIILSQIKSDNLDEIISNLVKQFSK